MQIQKPKIKVEIFNTDFQKAYIVNSLDTKIPLTDIPVGRFVTEVKVNDKLIIITLLRHENISQSYCIDYVDSKAMPTADIDMKSFNN